MKNLAIKNLIKAKCTSASENKKSIDFTDRSAPGGKMLLYKLILPKFVAVVSEKWLNVSRLRYRRLPRKTVVAIVVK